jgi:glyoxylase-like metal-dependent hydrolase (beta-lactamase superfamily II)
MPLPFALNHINLWLLADGEGYAAVDTGFAQDPIKDAWKSVLAGKARRLTRSIVTHCHPDHLGLAAWLEQETGAPLWIAQGEYLAAHMMAEQIAGYSDQRHGRILPPPRPGPGAHRRAGRARQRLQARRAGNSRHLPRLFDGQVLKIGDHDWRTIVGHGHAPEHMSLYCAELGVLISGDMLLPRISTNISVMASTPEADPLGLFLASIDGFRSLPADTLVLPSHGRPFRGLHARIDQLHAHHAERCAVLLDACRGDAEEAPPT